MKLLSVSLADAYLILLSASLLAGVGATPLPLALGTDTAAVSRAAIDPSHLVVTSGRALPENAVPGLTFRSSDSLMARNLEISSTHRAKYQVPSLIVGEERIRIQRPSLEAVGNPIQQLLKKELEKERYKQENTAIQMLRLDLHFALVEENDFQNSEALEKEITTELEILSNSGGTDSVVGECATRVLYFREVLRRTHNVVRTAPPQLPGYVMLDDDRYSTFLRNEIAKLGGDGGTQQKKPLTLAQRITELGLRYNLIREISIDDWKIRDLEIKKFEANLEYFKELKEDAGSTEAEVRECKARAKYYHDLFLEVSRKVSR
ncbi:hypothetical protein H0H93_005531 [Arthromyces matolae]|nr:hypothetical protein H0H93_005531 [Arthromyces matolae]